MDDGSDERDKDLVVREWMDPADGQKEAFFWNTMWVILDRGGETVLWDLWTVWQLLVLFAGNDNFPVLFRVPEMLGAWGLWVEGVVAHAVLGVAVLLGRVVGLRSRYKEYTPGVYFRTMIL